MKLFARKPRWGVYVDGKLLREFRSKAEADERAQLMGLALWDQQCQGSGMVDPERIAVKEVGKSQESLWEFVYYNCQVNELPVERETGTRQQMLARQAIVEEHCGRSATISIGEVK